MNYELSFWPKGFQCCQATFVIHTPLSDSPDRRVKLGTHRPNIDRYWLVQKKLADIVSGWTAGFCRMGMLENQQPFIIQLALVCSGSGAVPLSEHSSSVRRSLYYHCIVSTASSSVFFFEQPSGLNKNKMKVCTRLYTNFSELKNTVVSPPFLQPVNWTIKEQPQNNKKYIKKMYSCSPIETACTFVLGEWSKIECSL